MTTLTLTADELRAMAANDLNAYASGDTLYLAREARFDGDRLVATMEDILGELGYTEPEFADEDTVEIEAD